MRSIFTMNESLCKDLDICVAVLNASSHQYYLVSEEVPDVPTMTMVTCLMVRPVKYPHPTDGIHWLIQPALHPPLPSDPERIVILATAASPQQYDDGIPQAPPDYDYTGLGKSWHKKLYLGVPPRCSCKQICFVQSCSNALQRIECDSRCKNKCLNKRFQTDTFKGVRIRDSGDPHRGRFLVTSSPLFKDQFVGSYKGRVCFPTSSFGRQQSSFRFLLHTIKATRIFLDAKWNADDPAASLRFVNHSCLPSGRFETWNVQGYYRIGFFMNTDVAENTELTADYRMVVHDPTDQVPCACPFLPVHNFPKLDPTKCQKVVCPSYSDADLLAEDVIDISGPDSPAQSILSRSHVRISNTSSSPPTSQFGLSSEQPAAADPPRDVGR
jgi:hypothetical protein